MRKREFYVPKVVGRCRLGVNAVSAGGSVHIHHCEPHRRNDMGAESKIAANGTTNAGGAMGVTVSFRYMNG